MGHYAPEMGSDWGKSCDRADEEGEIMTDKRTEAERQLTGECWTAFISERKEWVMGEMVAFQQGWEARAAREEELVMALRGLRNEVRGLLGIAEKELAAEVGITNMCVLDQKLRKAEAVLRERGRL